MWRILIISLVITSCTSVQKSDTNLTNARQGNRPASEPTEPLKARTEIPTISLLSKVAEDKIEHASEGDEVTGATLHKIQDSICAGKTKPNPHLLIHLIVPKAGPGFALDVAMDDRKFIVKQTKDYLENSLFFDLAEPHGTLPAEHGWVFVKKSNSVSGIWMSDSQHPDYVWKLERKEKPYPYNKYQKLYDLSFLIEHFTFTLPAKLACQIEFFKQTFADGAPIDCTDPTLQNLEKMGYKNESSIFAPSLVLPEDSRVHIWRRIISKSENIRETLQEDGIIFEVALDLSLFCAYGRPTTDLLSQ